MNYFGTDGIRLKEEFFTEKFLYSLVGAVARLDYKCVCIARDTRKSGVFIESALSFLFNLFNIEVISLGIVPSPCLALCTRILKCDLGIMITASHNPPEYNGIKFFDCFGKKIPKKIEEKIENYLKSEYLFSSLRQKSRVFSGKDLYIEYLCDNFSFNLENSKILLDCANGATSNFVKDVFSQFFCSVTTVNDSDNGELINVNCGATHPKIVKNYDLAFFYDGDGDRVIASNENSILDGDALIYLVAKDYKTKHLLNNNVVVGTIMTNMGVERAYKNLGLKLLRSDVGDRCVYDLMQKSGAYLGGENSGHIIFGNYFATGDGIFSSLYLADINVKKKLSTKEITLLPTFNSEVFGEENALIYAINNVTIPKFDNVRTVVRKSGTEPKIRITVESENTDSGKNALNLITDMIKEKVNEYIQNKD